MVDYALIDKGELLVSYSAMIFPHQEINYNFEEYGAINSCSVSDRAEKFKATP